MTITKNSGHDKMSPGSFILRIIQGAFIGAGGILPGISGGVLCVVFGVYEPMMALLSHPVRSLKTWYKLFIPILIGWAIGFVLLAALVERMFETTSAVPLALFVGLISGTLPQLFRSSAKEPGEEKRGWTGFALALVLVYALFSVLNAGNMMQLTPNAGWFFFCGAVWGLSVVVPGLSSSSILIFMGLYQPMTAGIASMDFGVLLPLFAGIGLTVLVSARFVNYLLEKHYTLISRCILGVVIASTLMIVPSQFADAWELCAALAAFGLGFAAAWSMDRMRSRYQID